jgi:hypothetical protein
MGTVFPARRLALPGNPRRWRLGWKDMVARVCTNGRPVAWRGKLDVVVSMADGGGIKWPAGQLWHARGRARQPLL